MALSRRHIYLFVTFQSCSEIHSKRNKTKWVITNFVNHPVKLVGQAALTEVLLLPVHYVFATLGR